MLVAVRLRVQSHARQVDGKRVRAVGIAAAHDGVPVIWIRFNGMQVHR